MNKTSRNMNRECFIDHHGTFAGLLFGETEFHQFHKVLKLFYVNQQRTDRLRE